MNWKLIGAGIAAAAVLFAAGRYSAPTRVEIKTETVTVEKKTEDKKENVNTNTDRDKKIKKITVEITRPDGTKEVHTEFTEDTQTKKSTEKQTDTLTSTERETKATTSSVTERAGAGLRLQLLGGTDFTSLTSSPGLTYGVSISRPLLGPITMGLWGLSSGHGGVSLGLDF